MDGRIKLISRISPDSIYYGMDIGLHYLLLTSYEFLYQLHMSYFQKRRSKTVEVSFCGISVKHHMPEWYDI